MGPLTLSVLDLCPILSGKSARESFSACVELAQFTEELGFERYWVAEHHNMEGIGSSAPEVLIAHLAQHTKKMRIGSGGIMLPNHSTYHIAEVFRTLEALYGRIDLGIGRAPGSGSKAAHALRRTTDLSAENFPQEVTDLLHYLQDELPLLAVPTKTTMPEVWMLGSSDFGALLAARMGLPYSFAQHFSGHSAVPIMRMYLEEFRPSRYLSRPKVTMGCHVILADTDEEAEELALSSDLSFIKFVQSGKSLPLPTVDEAKRSGLSREDSQQVRLTMPKFVGSKEKVLKEMTPYLRSGISGVVVTSMIHDQKKRQHSYRLLREIFPE